ncbi:MAG: sulfotransferase [Cyclobacteriaceae bacterium]
MKSILYILGAGRSGTTLVDILLGNSERVFSAGELNRFPKRNGIPPGREEGSAALNFWDEINNNISNRFQLDYLNQISHRIEHHNFLKRLGLSPTEWKDYHDYLNLIFESLSSRRSEQIIIDSSKYPLRAYELSRRLVNFKYCVYVKRHPVSVLRSFAKKGIEQPSKSWVGVLLYLMLVHAISWWVLKKLKLKGVKVLSVTIEEVTRDPYHFVESVENIFQLDLTCLKDKLKSKGTLTTGQLFDGNRIRLKKEIEIKEIKIPQKFTLKERFVYVCSKFWWR